MLRIRYIKRKRALFVKDIVGISFDMPKFNIGDYFMRYDVFGVYPVDFKDD